MAELRQKIITRDWVIIAKERAQRPEEFVREKKRIVPAPQYDPQGLFAPGTNTSLSKSCIA